MARTFHRKQSMNSMSEINVTPLLDLAFSLLIIFMITTPLLEQTIPLDLPAQNHHGQPTAVSTDFQSVSIDKTGQIFWGKNAEQVSLQELDARLAGIAQMPNPPVIHIRGDAANSYQRIIDVLDKVKSHQLTRISLDTRAK